MAEKFSKSILGNLKKMLHRAPEKPAAPAPRKPTAAKDGTRKHASSPSPVEPAPDTPEAEAKTDKKKPKNQPWYRHRQRW